MSAPNTSTTVISPGLTVCCRGIASLVWFPVERAKLLVQADGSANLLNRWKDGIYRGCFSSLSQRTVSSALMLYGQKWLSPVTETVTTYKSFNQGLAGLLSGSIAGIIQSPFEYYKVRRSIVNMPAALSTLRGLHVAAVPMMLRHGVFDGTFFFTRQILVDRGNNSPALLFGVSGAAASAANLVFDVWKTQSASNYPLRTPFFAIISQFSSNHVAFFSQLAIKALDLGGNWYVTGLCVSAVLAIHHV